MTPRKKVTSGATSKGKAKAIVGGMTSKWINNQLFAEGTASATLQEFVSIQSPQQQENQLFQMLWEIKEQMKEQQ